MKNKDAGDIARPMFENLTEQVKNLIIPFAATLDVEVIELKIRRRGKSVLIEVLADKEHGGRTIDECRWINKFLSKQLEEGIMIDGDYMVDVSSPGLDRPLRTQKDFQRVVGREVRFYLSQPLENKRELVGVIKEVLEKGIVIDSKQNPLTVSLETIQKAVQVI